MQIMPEPPQVPVNLISCRYQRPADLVLSHRDLVSSALTLQDRTPFEPKDRSPPQSREIKIQASPSSRYPKRFALHVQGLICNHRQALRCSSEYRLRLNPL